LPAAGAWKLAGGWGDPNAQEIHNDIRVDFEISSETHIYAVQWTPTQMEPPPGRC
jgi:hypothetical protein